jgi:hypothetical protein
MTEDLNNSHSPEDNFDRREAVWHTNSSDTPIIIIGRVETQSGRIFYNIEGSNTAVPAEEVEFKSSQEEQVQPFDLTAERQIARSKIGELINERHAKAIRDKEAGKKGSYDAKIALYEALREANNAGNFDKVVQDTSVRKFVEELFNQQKKQTDELIAAVDSAPNDKARLEKQRQLDKTYDLYDLAEAAQHALEKVEASLAPVPEQAPEPEPAPAPPEPPKPPDTDEKKGSQQKREHDRVKPDYKFIKGEIVKLRTKDGKREFDWRVKASFVGKANVIYVKLEDPNGKLPDRVRPQDVLLELDPRGDARGVGEGSEQPPTPPVGYNEGVDTGEPDDTEPPENGGDGNGDNHDNNGHRNDDGNGNAHNLADDNEGFDENSSWLHPKRIQELKAQYAEALGANRSQISEAAKQHLKYLLIHREIKSTLKYARQVQERHGLGIAPEFPNQATIDRMAEMMEWADESLQESIDLGKFKKGQEVKIVKSDGSIEDGWKVKGYQKHLGGEGYDVVVARGREQRNFAPSELERFQEIANPDKDRINLEKLRDFINNPRDVKVKLADGRVVEGMFSGVSLNGGVYVDLDTGEFLTDNEGKVRKDPEGNPRPKINKLLIKNIDEFLSTQSEKTESEKKAEEWAELERKIGAYSQGQKIKVKNPDETGWLPGFTFVEYSPDEKTVIVAGPNGNKYQLIPKKFIDWQEEPGGEETIAVDQEEGDGVVMPEPEEGDPDAAEENPVEEKEEKEKDKEPRSWWRWTYDQWDKLPNNIAKNAAFAGFVLTAATVGSPMIVGFPVQHRIHYWRQRKKKEKADKEERERQEREESEASSRT